MPAKQHQVKKANLIAKRAFLLASWAARRLDAFVTLENPSTSYLWLTSVSKRSCGDGQVELSQCRFGSAYRKNTRVRYWNFRPSELERICVKKDGQNTCGNPQHSVLGFDGLPTGPAAEYPAKLCAAWARAVVRYCCTVISEELALESTVLHSGGRVHRHQLRGQTDESRREKKEAEDNASLAGMRNPASVVHQWPRLKQAMAPIR